MKRFRGGIHPHYEKFSGSREVVNADLPAKVIIPLQQHIGAPSQPLIQVGALVKKGQKIGEASGFVSSNVHASISGKVTNISNYLYPNPLGRAALSVVIESDGKDEWSEDVTPHGDLDSLNIEQLLDIIREAGIVGMGGAAFPTHVKLSIPKGKEIDTIILNGVECEPYITSDHRLMVEEPEKIVDGLRFMMRITNVERGFIGIEMNKPDAIQVMKKAASSQPNVKVFPLENKYPQGWENMLVKAVLDREVPPENLPLDVGVLVSNVGTAAAISNALRLGQPLIERIISVTGPGVKQPKNLRVRIGTPFLDLIEQCGGFKGTPQKFIAGGPMMGFAMFDMNVPVVKGTTSILVFSDKDTKIQDRRMCIRCGRCVSVCPARLMPTMIASLTEKGKFEEAEDYFPMDCKECGCCAYVCPAKIPLVQLIQFAKANVSSFRKA